MATEGEGGILKQVIVGVLISVLTALVLYMLGIGSGADTAQSQPPPGRPEPSPRVAAVCRTSYGACPLVHIMAPGTSCACYNMFGVPVVWGITQ